MTYFLLPAFFKKPQAHTCIHIHTHAHTFLSKATHGRGAILKIHSSLLRCCTHTSTLSVLNHVHMFDPVRGKEVWSMLLGPHESLQEDWKPKDFIWNGRFVYILKDFKLDSFRRCFKHKQFRWISNRFGVLMCTHVVLVSLGMSASLACVLIDAAVLPRWLRKNRC